MLPVKELAIVVTGIVVCFYCCSVRPTGAYVLPQRAAVEALMSQMNYEPIPRDKASLEEFRID